MTRLLATALLAALALTACSGGEETEGPTREEYVGQASSVCDSAVEEVEALQRPTSAAAFAPYVEELVGVARSVSERLRAIEPPPADREQLEARLLDPLDEQVEAGEAFAQRVRDAGEDQAALVGLLGEAPGTGDIDLEYAREYGLDRCADAVDAVTG